MLRELLKEAGLGIDDVRWYLARQFAERLLQYRERERELVELIWSKRLEAELYDMEEEFLRETERQLDQNQIDESRVREIVKEIRSARAYRYPG